MRLRDLRTKKDRVLVARKVQNIIGWADEHQLLFLTLDHIDDSQMREREDAGVVAQLREPSDGSVYPSPAGATDRHDRDSLQI